ncbi:hypothetical protein HY251_21465, partial [bacterium]|nr:hypothetical protein [bacterium]
IESRKLNAAPVAAELKRKLGPKSSFDPSTPEKWKFEHIIGVCGPGPAPAGLGVLSATAMKMADHVRTVRNIAHPANERTALASTRLEPADAKQAQALLEKVIAEVDRFFFRGGSAHLHAAVVVGMMDEATKALIKTRLLSSDPDDVLAGAWALVLTVTVEAPAARLQHRTLERPESHVPPGLQRILVLLLTRSPRPGIPSCSAIHESQ